MENLPSVLDEASGELALDLRRVRLLEASRELSRQGSCRALVQFDRAVLWRFGSFDETNLEPGCEEEDKGWEVHVVNVGWCCCWLVECV